MPEAISGAGSPRPSSEIMAHIDPRIPDSRPWNLEKIRGTWRAPDRARPGRRCNNLNTLYSRRLTSPAPGFGPVNQACLETSTASAVCTPHGKSFKRLLSPHPTSTGLKPGAGERLRNIRANQGTTARTSTLPKDASRVHCTRCKSSQRNDPSCRLRYDFGQVNLETP